MQETPANLAATSGSRLGVLPAGGMKGKWVFHIAGETAGANAFPRILRHKFLPCCTVNVPVTLHNLLSQFWDLQSTSSPLSLSLTCSLTHTLAPYLCLGGFLPNYQS